MKEFLTSMIGSIFKILPLYDENNVGLQSHIDSVAIQLIGAMDTFQELKTTQKYIPVINSINFLRKNEYTKRQCKREVLRCTNILEKMINE